ncbi:MAG: hypothetical protein Q7R39_08250 [Dehalococcoidia bacterium]|nr:hypothetical protein [Dehalococcoidia bacterium]
MGLNLTLMAVDSLVIPEPGTLRVAPVTPRQAPQARPARTEPPNQLILFLRGLGIPPAGITFPQPEIRQSPMDPRQSNQSRTESSLRPFGLHQSGLGGIALDIVALLAFLSIAIVLTYFLPERLQVMRDMLREPWSHKLRIMAIGIFGYLAAALLASVLAALVSGLIYSILVIAILTGLTVIGVTSVALAVGRWLTMRVGASPLPLAQLLVGILVIFPLTVLPYYVGWVAAGIVASFGMGTILVTRIGAGTPWTLETLQ